MFPQFVTFTGLDEKADLDRCADLSTRYPIEWGVLFSGRLGKRRYPSLDVRMRIESTELRLAAHLCGEVARSMQSGEKLPLARYGRVQVNARQYEIEALARQSATMDRRLILQWRQDVFPDQREFDWLLDRSGGRGVLETVFPKPRRPDQLVGYAGGINPDNVSSVLSAIHAHNFWIDMETGVRTDDWLDLDKCEAVCRAIWPDGAPHPEHGGL